MLGVAGALAVEVLGFGNWYDAPLWAVNGGNATWFGVPIPFFDLINTRLRFFVSNRFAAGVCEFTRMNRGPAPLGNAAPRFVSGWGVVG
jgi:hypothetical protein